MYRTHNCGELRESDIDKKVVLSGWINKIRNFRSLFFIDIRDYFGITQLIIYKKLVKNINIGKEFLIKIFGKVVKRNEKNKNLSTGSIEILVSSIEIINESKPTPFLIEDYTDGKEKDRMIYRYLDIRRLPIKNNLIFRHNLVLEIRNFLSSKKFLEIETPTLINYTPEGARGFLVPYRRDNKKFYSLPQSPQIFKQLLMIGGIDKYFQIVKCFRDEDSRSDRQIEFTQVDCEMAFVDTKDILIFFENFIKHLFIKTNNFVINNSFPKISYYNSIKIYGTDCPDIRFGMKFNELNKLIYKENINFFKKNDLIIGIKINNLNSLENDILTDKIKNENIFCIKHLSKNKFILSKKIPIKSYDINVISKYFKTSQGDSLFISYGTKKKARFLLNYIRKKIIKFFSLKNKDSIFKPIWITDLPLLKWDNDNKKYKSIHHPFTSPKKEDIHLLTTNPENVRSESYDLVINGVEIASGSIRIHDKNIQKLIFNYLGFSNEEIYCKFGFFIKAFKYGVPPHGGIAFGLDRLTKLLKRGCDIKDFIAFPKNNLGKDLMTNAPNKL